MVQSWFIAPINHPSLQVDYSKILLNIDIIHGMYSARYKVKLPPGIPQLASVYLGCASLGLLAQQSPASKKVRVTAKA